LILDVLTRLGCRLGGGAMRFCVSGAAPLSEPVRERFAEAYGFPIIPAYGLTETTCFCTISPHDAVVPGSAGVPAGIEVRVVSETGAELPPGEIGEIAVRGPSVMAGGYYKGPRDCYLDAGPQAEGTWFRTGDLGRLDEAGYIFLTGRKKNMVIRGGEKIYLEDIDRCLADCPGVSDSATIRLGGDVERIVCFVVPAAEAPASPHQVLDFIAGRLGRSRQPDRVELRDSIARTATNKVRLGELQRLAGAAP
jgi:acyl-CoA synthetase (AMP-forming)/AMP-acid ligase II